MANEQWDEVTIRFASGIEARFKARVSIDTDAMPAFVEIGEVLPLVIT